MPLHMCIHTKQQGNLIALLQLKHNLKRDVSVSFSLELNIPGLTLIVAIWCYNRFSWILKLFLCYT